MTGADGRGGGPSAPPGKRKTTGSAAEFAGIGFQFAGAILLFLFAGQWLDRRLGTAPLFLIVGVFLGAGAAFYSMYRRLMAAQRRDSEERKRQ
jgi:ATP synthase protein I